MKKATVIQSSLTCLLAIMLLSANTSGLAQQDGSGPQTEDIVRGIFSDLINRATSGGLVKPTLSWPDHNQQFNQYNGTLPLRWEQVNKAKNYDIQIDCLNCQNQGQWGSDRGNPWQTIQGISETVYQLDLSSVPVEGQWKWRVRASRGPTQKSQWTQWSYFAFQGSTAQPGYYGQSSTQGEYTDQGGYPNQGGYSQQGGYPNQDGYSQQGGYPNQDGYSQQGDYPGQ